VQPHRAFAWVVGVLLALALGAGKATVRDLGHAACARGGRACVGTCARMSSRQAGVGRRSCAHHPPRHQTCRHAHAPATHCLAVPLLAEPITFLRQSAWYKDTPQLGIVHVIECTSCAYRSVPQHASSEVQPGVRCLLCCHQQRTVHQPRQVWLWPQQQLLSCRSARTAWCACRPRSHAHPVHACVRLLCAQGANICQLDLLHVTVRATLRLSGPGSGSSCCCALAVGCRSAVRVEGWRFKRGGERWVGGVGTMQ
jgi:hypothetical protein